MTRRSGRSPTLHDPAALLSALEACRRECNKAQAQLTIGGEAYRAISAYMVALDDLAGHLTGDRERFWIKARRY